MARVQIPVAAFLSLTLRERRIRQEVIRTLGVAAAERSEVDRLPLVQIQTDEVGRRVRQ